MTGALLILAVTVAIGILLWAWEKFRSQRHGHTLHHNHQQALPPSEGEAETASELVASEAPPSGGGGGLSVCCGLHAICEKTGQINEPPVYYDDEELDRFAGCSADEYSDSEIEEFRDVMLSLLLSDVAGWCLSLEKRRINLPTELRPEFEFLLSAANDHEL